MGGSEVVGSAVDIRAKLAFDGFVVVGGAAFHLSRQGRRGLAELCESCHDLPPDRYLPDGGTYRYRRYGAFRVSPGAVTRQPHRPYYQSLDINPVAGGLQRQFAPLAESRQANRFLTALLRYNVDCLPGSGAGEWQVDVHLVRVVASPVGDGHPSPEGQHRDGFDYISIHLLGLTDSAAGGLSHVMRVDGTTAVTVRLSRTLDSLYLDDRLLTHDVTPLAATTGDPVCRDVLLMSYRGGER